MIKRLNPRRSTSEDQTSRGTDIEARIQEVLKPIPSPTKCTFPAHVITQAELQEYLRLVEASRQQGELRLSIVERLKNGVPVEPGELEPFILEESRRRCGWKILEEVLGHKETDRIKQLVQETESQCLRIRDSQGTILGWGDKRQSGRADP
jgi:hypothetical protein